MMPHTRFHRTVRHTSTAVTMANGHSTRTTDVKEAMFPVVGHSIAPQSLVVPGLRAGLIAAGQVANHHDILIQNRPMFVDPRGPPPATKLTHARGIKVRGVYQLYVAQPHTVHAVARIPARDQVLHRTFSHAGVNALRPIDRAHPTTRATLDKRLATLKSTNDCTGCHERRATRAPFPTRACGESVESSTLKPLDVIVTDITGPITPSVAPRKATSKLRKTARPTSLPSSRSQRAQTFQPHSATLSPLGSSPAAPSPNSFIPTMLRSRSAPPLQPIYMHKVHRLGQLPHTLRPKMAPPNARFAQS
jgi:hypothetical protein